MKYNENFNIHMLSRLNKFIASWRGLRNIGHIITKQPHVKKWLVTMVNKTWDKHSISLEKHTKHENKFILQSKTKHVLQNHYQHFSSKIGMKIKNTQENKNNGSISFGKWEGCQLGAQ